MTKKKTTENPKRTKVWKKFANKTKNSCLCTTNDVALSTPVDRFFSSSFIALGISA